MSSGRWLKQLLVKSKLRSFLLIQESGFLRTDASACCAHLGLCLGNEGLVGTKLIRQPGASDLDWLDVLDG